MVLLAIHGSASNCFLCFCFQRSAGLPLRNFPFFERASACLGERPLVLRLLLWNFFVFAILKFGELTFWLGLFYGDHEGLPLL